MAAKRNHERVRRLAVRRACWEYRWFGPRNTITNLRRQLAFRNVYRSYCDANGLAY